MSKIAELIEQLLAESYGIEKRSEDAHKASTEAEAASKNAKDKLSHKKAGRLHDAAAQKHQFSAEEQKFGDLKNHKYHVRMADHHTAQANKHWHEHGTLKEEILAEARKSAKKRKTKRFRFKTPGGTPEVRRHPINLPMRPTFVWER